MRERKVHYLIIRVFGSSCSRPLRDGCSVAIKFLAYIKKSTLFLGKSLDFDYLYANNGLVDRRMVQCLTAAIL